MQLTDGKLEVEGQKECKPPGLVSLRSLWGQGSPAPPPPPPRPQCPQWCPLTSERPRGLSSSTWFSGTQPRELTEERVPSIVLPAPRRGNRRGVSTQEKLLVGEGLAHRLLEYFYFLNISTLEARNTTKRL